jgi:hypothetical protein
MSDEIVENLWGGYIVAVVVVYDLLRSRHHKVELVRLVMEIGSKASESSAVHQ